jgi:hypothetical protein
LDTQDGLFILIEADGKTIFQVPISSPDNITEKEIRQTTTLFASLVKRYKGERHIEISGDITIDIRSRIVRSALFKFPELARYLLIEY